MSLKDKITKTNWTDLVFLAEANNEWFEEVKITTLKSYYEEEVYSRAWKLIKDPEELDAHARTIMESGEIKVQEYIKTNEECEVEICIDCDVITDSVVELGEKMSYNYKDIWEHNNLHETNNRQNP